jgi:hypothetical protein
MTLVAHADIGEQYQLHYDRALADNQEISQIPGWW